MLNQEKNWILLQAFKQYYRTLKIKVAGISGIHLSWKFIKIGLINQGKVKINENYYKRNVKKIKIMCRYLKRIKSKQSLL